MNQNTLKPLILYTSKVHGNKNQYYFDIIFNGYHLLIIKIQSLTYNMIRLKYPLIIFQYTHVKNLDNIELLAEIITFRDSRYMWQPCSYLFNI